MKKAFNSVMRDGLEQSIIRKTKLVIPNYDQHLARYRFPLLPKIVVYSSIASTKNFFGSIFPVFNYINPTLSAETDEIISRRIAEQLMNPVENKNQTLVNDTRTGYIIEGFPFNTNQALLFDKYLNGVNLAIYLHDKNVNKEFETSIKPLLDYYDRTGALHQIVHIEDPNFEQFQTIVEDINAKIKRTH